MNEDNAHAIVSNCVEALISSAEADLSCGDMNLDDFKAVVKTSVGDLHINIYKDNSHEIYVDDPKGREFPALTDAIDEALPDWNDIIATWKMEYPDEWDNEDDYDEDI